MPNEQVSFMTSSSLMRTEEIEKIALIFVALGVKKIRLTGGEPLVRKEFAQIVERLSNLPVELTLTTNGIHIDKYLSVFSDYDVRSINVSLDSMKPDVFRKITGRDQFDIVWRNIMALVERDFHVKVNVVALPGLIEEEIIDFIELTRNLPLHVRFIEFMPFPGNHWAHTKVVTTSRMLEIVNTTFDFDKLTDRPGETAKKYTVKGFTGTFAFITTMTEFFCGSCNRLRITADGKLKNCLFGKEETDLLSALRAGDDIVPLIERSVYRKNPVMGGQFGDGYEQVNTEMILNRNMVRIGG
jgi:cyclic pyranopterin phosphate synthase